MYYRLWILDSLEYSFLMNVYKRDAYYTLSIKRMDSVVKSTTLPTNSPPRKGRSVATSCINFKCNKLEIE